MKMIFEPGSRHIGFNYRKPKYAADMRRGRDFDQSNIYLNSINISSGEEGVA